ncbi:MAG: MBL fold metallo-hydrolase [Myxococcaceae bacterium]|nr:MBL fold metallo-hydrolase [Myxococcaceae bacterium]
MTPMASSDLLILDVGHGNCALVSDGADAAVVDAPQGATLVEALEHLGTKRIKAVYVSHADADHVGGVIGLLSNPDFSVDAVYVNPDSHKDSDTWHDFRFAVKDAQRRNAALKVHSELTTTTVCPKVSGRHEMRVLWPTPDIALAGSGGKDLKERPLTSNSTSAVMLVTSEGKNLAVLCGDIDGVALANIEEDKIEMKARVLVFPHHGGLPRSAAPFAFAKGLCALVSPDAVVFSMSRRGHRNPLPEIVAGVRAAAPKAYVICTQLSTNCSSSDPKTAPTHLSAAPSQGARRQHACGGTLSLDMSSSFAVRAPDTVKHGSFVQSNAPTALCLGKGPKVRPN